MGTIIGIILAILILLWIFIISPNNDKESCNIYANQAEQFSSYSDEYTWCMNNKEKWK